MTKENGPQDYQFKHSTHISLDPYRGIANGIMDINNPVADNFMRVSDMRRNIVVVGKRPKRTYEYEELGPVRVGKLALLKFGTLEDNEGSSIGKNDEDWVIAINDRAMWNQLPQDKSLKIKQGQFVQLFKDEVRKGAIHCLIREKILNGDVYSPAVLMALAGSGVMYPTAVLAEIDSILAGQHSLGIDINVLLLTATSHFICNTISYTLATVRKKFEQIGPINEILPETSGMRFAPDYKEPYVRHKFLEFFATTNTFGSARKRSYLRQTTWEKSN